MKNLVSLFLIFICLLSACRHVDLHLVPQEKEIIVSDEISDFIGRVERALAQKKKTVVVFDIDDTLFNAQGHVGTSPWFYGMTKKLQQSGIAKESAQKIMGTIDKKLQAFVPVKMVEHSTLKAIEEWQKQKVMVLALTSRPSHLKEVTLSQFKSLGIKLWHEDFHCIEQHWKNKQGHFSDGIIYAASSTSKELIFDHFLQNLRVCNSNPEVIAYIDDQDKYVEQIKNSAAKSNSTFIGNIYKRAINFRQFDMEKANQELAQIICKHDAYLIPSDLHRYFFSNLTLLCKHI
ncbi:MAG: DUF2608 domain-containing protein [Myxococcales bacterium]|nr:DUF2608 domain-containing protein [Myxococcales bacterium]USN51119.1 MAG: DUF2608 domain-containing protein [Myxococcales bacterium]